MASGSDPFDGLNKALQDDMQQVKQLNRKGAGDLSPPVIIETVLWGLCITSIIAMIGSMLWVGPDKAIPGHIWLGYSIIGICVFGGMALLMRWVRDFGPDADRKMTRKFERGR